MILMINITVVNSKIFPSQGPFQHKEQLSICVFHVLGDLYETGTSTYASVRLLFIQLQPLVWSRGSGDSRFDVSHNFHFWGCYSRHLVPSRCRYTELLLDQIMDDKNVLERACYNAALEVERLKIALGSLGFAYLRPSDDIGVIYQCLTSFFFLSSRTMISGTGLLPISIAICCPA